MTWQRARSAGRCLADDGGSGIVLAFAAISVLMVAALVSWTIAVGVAAHQRVSVAADLAALAGAHHEGGPDCRAAASVAIANGVRLDGCDVQGQDVVVHVSMDAPALVARAASIAGDTVGRFTAASRAGPR